MAVVDNQDATAANFNAALASKQVDNTLIGKQTLARPASGATVNDVQQSINDNAADIISAQSDIDTHVADTSNPHAVTKAQVGLGAVDNTSDADKPVSTAQQAALDLKIDLTEKGAANGVAPINGSSKIDSTYLPSYVDDVLEYANFASLPISGETGKIYVTLDTNKTYRWTGSIYVEVSQGVTDHTQLSSIGTNTHAQIDTHIASTSNPHSVTKTQVGLSNVVNADTTTTANITDSSNKRFVTDAQLVVIGNTSGTNTGDQTSVIGNSGSTDALKSATTTVNVSSATAPTSGQVLTATSSTTATWQTPSASGSVTSVALSAPSEFTVSGSPVTSSGTLTFTKASQTQNLIYASPNGSSGVPTFRSIVAADIPNTAVSAGSYTNTNLTVDAQGRITSASNGTASSTFAQTSKTTTYSISGSDYGILCDSSGAAFTVTLPTAVGASGKEYVIKKTDSSFNAVTIATTSSQTIDGATTAKLSTQYETITLQSDGSNWVIYSRRITSAWTSYTPTFTGLGTNTSIEYRWRRNGPNIEIVGKSTVGTTSATEARISLPSGLTSGSTTPIPSIRQMGTWINGASSANHGGAVLVEPAVTYMTFGSGAAYGSGTFNALTKQNGSNMGLVDSTSAMSISVSLPIDGWEG